MSKVAAQPGPRFRVLGERAAFTKHGLDGQEPAMAAGGIPGAPGWGEEPAARWGVVGEDGATQPVRTIAGDYLQFYAAVAAAVRDGAPVPVEPAEAIAGLAILEAARASAERGELVQLPG
jgi:predicted dehydrogenase